MSPAEFRQRGHELIDWIASYWDQLRATHPPHPTSDIPHPPSPVLSQVKPGEIFNSLPAHAPEHAEGWDQILADFQRLVMPGITHWQSPGFFGYFSANASGPAVLGELLSAGLGVQGMLWTTSPAATEVETRMLDWMAQLIGLPAQFLSASPNGGGVIQGTASESTLIAMLAARRREQAKGGTREGRLVAYASTQAHSSVIKGAMIAGITDGPEDRVGVRLIETGDSLAMDPAALERAIREDLAAGRRPFYICATVGTTSSTAIDPLPAIGRIARDHALWLHVDAAMAGAACICPEYRHFLAGVELADSVCFNPHKSLLTNFDCDLMWTSDRASLIRALSVTPEYLRNKASEGGGVIDYRDWQIPLGRRFRALKLWFVVRHYGAEGLRAHIREHMRLAELFEGLLRTDDRFELAAPRTMSLVCFKLRGQGKQTDDRNRRLLESVNAAGRIFITHTVLPRKGYVLRLAIGGTFTQEQHVRGAWEVLREAAEAEVKSEK
jgi:aromatic-L-amino-acid decarboxylase